MVDEDERAHWLSRTLSLQLQQYQFDIIHRAGGLNGNAVIEMSRRSYSSTLSIPIAALHDSCPPQSVLYNLQRQDSELSVTIDYCKIT